MSQVNNDNTTNSILSNLNIANKNKDDKNSNELGQSAFLELMITQMNNQDPLSPQDNGDFIAQLAQFSSVEGLERLNNRFEEFSGSFMSNQALQASSLVGRQVTVPTEKTLLFDGGIVSGSVRLEESTNDMRINVYDEAGEQVSAIPLGSRPAGDLSFRWDGQNVEVNGELLDWIGGEEPLPGGEYRFEVLVTQDGKTEQLETALSANVNSVSMGDDGRLTLNLAGLGAVNIGDVKQFN
ncbi:flagellar hook assembly protein FlgD [Marinimicrobium sp. ARAG 43.8]|uniref:flagellar hook assembly protein FlgD n=1 Tax=Marinimicrobium sp. ARAG 43.8 TaxID=3418719 RepID=UPI003CF24AED